LQNDYMLIDWQVDEGYIVSISFL